LTGQVNDLTNPNLTNLKAPSVCAVGTSGMARG